MTNMSRVSPYLRPQISGAGADPIDPGPKGACTLVAGTTYYYPFGDDSSPLQSVHLKWDSAIIVTFTVETTNFPVGDYGNAIALTGATLGAWMQENPSTAYVSGNGAGGLTVTALTLVVAGGTAGAATVHIGNLGTLRGRIKAVVGGTGGVVQLAGCAKEH